jgi:hypothetical protein
MVYMSMFEDWKINLDVIELASEEALAVVESAQLFFNFDTIQLDAQFLFLKTINLKIQVKIPTATTTTSIIIQPDPFAAIHCMPHLQKLDLFLDESGERVDRFTPSLPELRDFSLWIDMAVFAELSPTAFDQLPRLRELNIRRTDHIVLNKFETGMTADTIHCFWVNHLKLNSAAADSIKEIAIYHGMLTSMQPLSGLQILRINPDKHVDFTNYFCQSTNLKNLSIDLYDLSSINRGQLSYLSKLEVLFIRCQSKTSTEGIFFEI